MNKLVYQDLEIGVTAECNCSCIYCGVNKKKIIEHPKKNLIRTITDLGLIKSGDGYVSVTGGEPTMVPDITSQILKDIREYLPEKTIVLNTNGTIFNPEIFDLADILHVSVNDLYSTHQDQLGFNEFRYPDTPNLYRTIQKTLISDYPKTIETILTTRISYPKLLNLYGYIKNLPNVNLWEISRMIPTLPEHNQIYLKDTDLMKILVSFFFRYNTFPRENRLDTRINCCGLRNPVFNDYIRHCPEGNTRIHVNVDGSIQACDVGTAHIPTNFGNVYDGVNIEALRIYKLCMPLIRECQWARIQEYQDNMGE
jgi:sulfatase maturation enzyme AslB (radical SAM superfamily)